MGEFKSVDFFSKISDYVLIFKDKEVVYHGLKEVVKRPSTKIVFKKGKYTCTDAYTYKLIKESNPFKKGTIVRMSDIKVPTITNGIVFKKTTLSRMSKDDLIDVATQMNIVMKDVEAAKPEYIDAILAKQEGIAPIVIVPEANAHKGTATINSVSTDPSIKVPAPEVE